MNDMLTFEFIYSFHMLPFMFVARFVCFNPKKSYSLMNIESVVHLILSHPLWAVSYTHLTLPTKLEV